MQKINDLVLAVSDFVWLILMFVLVGSGIYFSIKTKFVQIRKFKSGWNKVFGNIKFFGNKADNNGMSSFQALTTAIAAQVGTGNIVGCVTALVSGGPGAIFWMWIAAFFGMSTIYSEATLAQVTKQKSKSGAVIGGPVYYIKQAFKGKKGTILATIFSILIILALGIMGNMVQSNSISDGFYNAFGTPKLATGIICALIAGFIFLGGISRIASFTEKVVPLMAVLYILSGAFCLFIFRHNLIPAIVSIYKYAFTPYAVVGGGMGIVVKQAMRFGVARGLFSNEAGMGSTPHSHAIAKVKNPTDQGEVAMIGVFFDTFVVLTITALVILCSGILPFAMENSITGVQVAQKAFSMALGKTAGPAFIAIALLFFAFSTIISWYFFAEQNVKYLFGKRAVKFFAVIVIVAIILGSVLKVELVWNAADLFNGLMVIPNILALLALSGLIGRLAKGKKVDMDKENKSEIQK
ncbi:MAG: sodium:alanine symporter family protein [Clostridia bacterium]|nr:sodium:alanine symporter family protein [Clostridia bacterium]